MTIEGVKVEAVSLGAGAHERRSRGVPPGQKVVATGDIIAANRADDNPNIHLEKNGSTSGWITRTPRRSQASPRRRSFVPGHGPMQTKADVQDRLKVIERSARRSRRWSSRGRRSTEIKAAIPDSPAPAPAGGAPAAAPAASRRSAAERYTDWTYQELTKK